MSWQKATREVADMQAERRVWETDRALHRAELGSARTKFEEREALVLNLRTMVRWLDPVIMLLVEVQGSLQ